MTPQNAWQHLIIQNLDTYIGIVDHFWTIQSILCISKKLTNSVNQRSNTKKQITIKMKSCNEIDNEILLDMKTLYEDMDHILVYFIGSKLGLYVSFLIRLQLAFQQNDKMVGALAALVGRQKNIDVGLFRVVLESRFQGISSQGLSRTFPLIVKT